MSIKLITKVALISLLFVAIACNKISKNRVEDFSNATYEFNTTEAKEWFLKQHESLKQDYFVGQFGVDSHPAGWDRGAYLRAYIDMYEATKDIEILRKLNELLQIVANGNDMITGRIDERTGTVMPGWGYRGYDFGNNGEKRYSEMLTNALYSYPLAAFARIVKEDPKLNAEFGYDANRYYQMVKEIYDAHKPFVKGMSGEYVELPSNFVAHSVDLSHIEAPTNYTVIIAEPIVELYRASKASGSEDNNLKDIAISVGNYIYNNMQTKECSNSNRYFTWHYWSADIDKSSQDRMEDLTHGAKLAQFVLSLYNAGLTDIWNRARLKQLANTFTCGVVIGKNKFANYIDGTGGEYSDDAATLYDWLDLQKFSSSTYKGSIAYYIKNAMMANGDNEYYNLAVVAKFVRFVAKEKQ